MNKPTIAERLRTIRAARNAQKKDVVEALRINPKTLNRWESGESEPRASEIAALAEFFGVSSDYLIGRCDTENGLEPGRWIIDLDELDDPKTGDVGIEIPRRTKIVDSSDAMRMQREAQKRLNERSKS